MVQVNFKSDKVQLNYSEEDKRFRINVDKIKQFIAMVGGFLATLYLALNASGIYAEWLNPETIDAWVSVLNSGIPLLFIFYGLWKNTFIITRRSREQEQFLKENGKK